MAHGQRNMTGYEKMEAAFSPRGTRDTPAVICYEGIFIRDHWPQLTTRPWCYLHTPSVEEQVEWQEEYAQRVPMDWFQATAFYSRREREELFIDVRPDGVFLANRRTGEARRLNEPTIGGWDPAGVSREIRPDQLPRTEADVDAAIPLAPEFDREAFLDAGRRDLFLAKAAGPGRGRWPLAAAASPFVGLYWTWGFEGTMILVGERPDLVRRACERLLHGSIQRARQAAALGARGVWIEETMTDMISPAAYEETALPTLGQLIEEIRRLGMKSIYYYCGNPWPKFEQLLAAGADALALEETKKDFAIDIEEVVRRVAGRCTVFGNLDAIGILEKASESDLRAEIARQLAAGRANAGRFVMSTGSPVTPGTHADRVRRYVELVHDVAGESEAV
jgi:hypothetical protein